MDSLHLPHCFAEVVDHIQASNFARIELLVLNAGSQETATKGLSGRPPLVRRIFNTLTDPARRKGLAYRLYQRVDAKLGDIAPVDPLEEVDCSERLEGIESYSVTPITKRFVHRFDPEAVEFIRSRQLDVLIRFGFNILRGEILTAAKHGVWSYHHGDNDYYRGGPAYFWEMYEGSPVSGAILQVLTEKLDDGLVLYKGYFATHPGLSERRNGVQPYWGASTFMIQKLHQLHEQGWDAVRNSALPPAPYHGKKPIYTKPANGEMARWLVSVLARKAGRLLVRRSTVNHWRLALREAAPMVADAAQAPDMAGFNWIESPPGRFYADPFLLEEAGGKYLFFEDFDYASQTGRISCGEVKHGQLVDVRPVIERPYHLSYPCIFRDGDQIFMIPETLGNNTVDLYRCVGFPHRWRFEKTLFQGRAVDTTVWIENGIYWFFTTLLDPRGGGSQLWLFSADSLTGEWTPHPANPVSTDVRTSRGAGAIFRRNGKLIRPSQDCSKTYGYSFALNEILVLDRERFQERPAVTVLPTWAPGLWASHSYAFAGNLEVVDGRTPLPSGPVLKPALVRGKAEGETAPGFAAGARM